MASRMGVSGLSGLVANVHAHNAALQRNVRAAQQENGEEHRQRMEDECPKDTGFTASKTRVDFSEGGLTYETGYRAEDFTSAGREFSVPYVVFGTSRQEQNDFMARASEPMREIATRRVGDAIRAAGDEVAQ